MRRQLLILTTFLNIENKKQPYVTINRNQLWRSDSVHDQLGAASRVLPLSYQSYHTKLGEDGMCLIAWFHNPAKESEILGYRIGTTLNKYAKVTQKNIQQKIILDHLDYIHLSVYLIQYFLTYYQHKSLLQVMFSVEQLFNF